MPERSVDVDQLDSGIGERDELSLGGRHGDAMLPARERVDSSAGEEDAEACIVDRRSDQFESARANSV